jgi:hypothetical protein
MSTDVDAAPRRGSRWYRWLAVLVVLATVAVVVTVRMVSAGGSSPPAQRPAGELPEALRTAVAARLVAELEKATPAEHAGHGHAVPAGAKLVCAVDVFGTEPPNATSIDQVGRVYALHLCGLAEPGKPWDQSTRYSGPLVADMGDPPQLYVVQPGAGYQQRVAQWFPERYRTRATGPFKDDKALADMRSRFDAIAG